MAEEILTGEIEIGERPLFKVDVDKFEIYNGPKIHKVAKELTKKEIEEIEEKVKKTKI